MPSYVARLNRRLRLAGSGLGALLEVLDDPFRGRLVRVEFEAEIAESGACEPAFDDFEGRLLFRKEKDPFAGFHRIRDDIGDRLRLPRPWRTLNDQVFAAHDVDERAVLGCIRVLDEKRRDLFDLGIIDVIILGNGGKRPTSTFRVLGAAQDRRNKAVLNGVDFPVFRVQVRIHRGATEREMSKHKPAAHVPTLPAFDHRLHLLQVFIDRSGLLVFSRTRNPEARTEIDPGAFGG